MHSSAKLAVPIVLASAIAAAVMFSIQPQHPSSQSTASAPDKVSGTHVLAAISTGDSSDEATLQDSSWMTWSPLTADGQ
jgi:hypothetical protein